MGKNINGDRPTAFPLEQEKLNFTIPVTDQPREKVAKLVQTITDRVPVKLKGVKGNDPEYWGLAAMVTDEMADELLSADDFAAYIRDDALDAGRAERVLHELRRCSGDHTAALPRNAREGALITVDSFVGRGAHWCYWSTDAAAQLPMAAVLCWLGDFLAGTERRTLQSCPKAVQLAAQWQADLASPFACPVDRMPQPMAPAAPAAARRASAQPVQNPRWQSILAVLATV